MTITFAIPFFSDTQAVGFDYLRRTIESVFAQTNSDWKAYVVDNASPIEGVKEFVDSVGQSRVGYYRNTENLGQAGNWNECIRKADTEYVTILHSDDELEPNYAEVMLARLSEHPDCAAVFCNAKIIDENSREISSFVDFVKKFIRSKGDFVLSGEDGLAQILKGNFIMAPTVCFRREKVQAISFSRDWRYIPDLYFWTLMLLSDLSLLGIPDVLFRYRRHTLAGTHDARRNAGSFEEEAKLYAHIAKVATERGWGKAVKAAQARTIIKLRTAYFMAQDLVQFRFKAALYKAGLFSRLFEARTQ